ncbi:zinc finger protein 587 isoform X11 [Cephus cinctus]|uniref:Zinc finger protein 587 isoform X11 n=1 Tax=Cephus cinctus TaxID=211228 RepID=A0AAJ7BN67_CEPCN|nr:zinc finger protein 587 isoform X11 [Cephus cinctus]
MAETARSGVNERRAPNDAGSSPAWVKQRTRPRARLASRTGVLHGKMSSLDYLDLCRLCLVKDRVSVPIFEGEGDVRQIFLKIAACLPVKVAREDKLPKKICDDCVYKVELFYQFWNTTANAEKQLLQWLGEVGLEEKQGYVTGVLNPSVMKQEQNSESRLDSNVMQQVSGHQDNMGGMTMIDNMGLGMPIMIPSGNQQQITSVPMDTSGNSVQTVRPVQQAVVAVAGPSAQPNHQEQLAQNQGSASATAGTGTNPTTATPTVVTASISHQDDEEDTTDEDENSDEECDADEGLPVKEESEEDPSNNRTIEPTTFVNVSLACDEAGPSGLQQQKITEMPEMSMPQAADGDPKSGSPVEEEEEEETESEELVSGRREEEELSKMKEEPVDESIDDEEEYQLEESTEITSSRRSDVVFQEDPISFVDDSSKTNNKYSRSVKRERGCAAAPHDYTKSKGYEAQDIGFGITYESIETTKREASSASSVTTDGATVAAESAVSENRLYQCQICAKRFRSKNLFEGHLVAHSDARPYQCDVCNKSFKRTNTLAVHKRIHTRERNFVCDVCGRAFVQASQLATHHRRHFEKYTRFCEICSKGFFTNAELHGHMNVKHEAKEHVCQVCAKSFPNNHTLARHLKMHDPNFKPVKHQCEFCGKTFAYKNSLVVHVKSHTGENKFDCHLCGKSVSSKGSLQDHLRLHGGEKSLVCDVCGKAFHKRTTLVVHKRTHTGEKPYSCDTCGKSFTQHSTLVIHKRYHTGQRPYQCSYCAKSFVSRALLNAHTKVHVVNVMIVQPV